MRTNAVEGESDFCDKNAKQVICFRRINEWVVVNAKTQNRNKMSDCPYLNVGPFRKVKKLELNERAVSYSKAIECVLLCYQFLVLFLLEISKFHTIHRFQVFSFCVVRNYQ